MDMKIDGLSYELLEEALNQAKQGRLHILDKMAETISVPNPDLKPHAPRIIEIIIEKSFIGAVIGPGGKIIQEMQAKTGTKINIEEVGDKGIINVAGTNKEGMDQAIAMIEKLPFHLRSEMYTMQLLHRSFHSEYLLTLETNPVCCTSVKCLTAASTM